jgi:hypothetical protein
MNLKRSFACAVILLLSPAGAYAQVGGGYDLTWNVVAGGAGNASSSSYTLSATAGQPSAALSNNGSLLLLAGFWNWPQYNVHLPLCLRGT